MDKRSAKRRRGVVASRSKLEQAKIKAGFKSQADLARAIARNEGADEESPPKDMVNRVFRGMPVDVHTLERIANALGVSSYSLYLSAGENVPDQEDELDLTESGELKSSRKYLVLILGTLLLLITLYLIFDRSKETVESAIAPLIPKQDFSIAIYDAGEKSASDFIDSFKTQFSDNVRFSLSELPDISEDIEPWQLAERLNSDIVVIFDTKTIQNYTLLNAYFYTENTKTPLLNKAFLTLRRESVVDQVSQEIAANLQSNNLLASLKNEGLKPTEVIDRQAVAFFVDGAVIFNESNGLEYNYQAVTSFLSAINRAPNYAKAYAGLCSAYTRLYLLKLSAAELEDAQFACAKALELDANNAYVQYAQGLLEDKENKFELAISRFDALLEQYPAWTDVVLAKTESKLRQGQKQGDPTLFDDALATINKLEPEENNNWKVPYTAGRVYYFRGEIKNAIQMNEISEALHTNYQVLTNLATMYFCFGDPAKALPIYEKTVFTRYAPPNALYNLAASYDYFQYYDKAIETIERFVDQQEETGSDIPIEAISGIADTYKSADLAEQAIFWHKKAFEKAEQQIAMFGSSPFLELQRLYAKSSIKVLQDSEVDDMYRRDVREQLDPILDQLVQPESIVRALLLFVLLEDIERAKPFYDMIAPSCKGFAMAPMFDGLGLR